MAPPSTPIARPLGEASSLPRMSVRACAALNRLHDRRAAPVRLRWQDTPLELRWFVDRMTGGAAALRGRYRFKLGPHAGELALDAPTQALLLDEPRFADLPADLRSVLLAQATHEWVDALVQSTRLPFEWTPGADIDLSATDPDVGCTASFSLHRPGQAAALMKGHVHLGSDEALDLIAPPLVPGATPRGDLPASLRFPIRFELGRTTLRLRELSAVVPGDIVSVEDWQPVGAGIVATAIVGDSAVANWTALAEGSRVTIQHCREEPMNQEVAAKPAQELAGPGEAALNGPVADRLDALEVTLRFDVGGQEVTLGELRNIRPGHVFELPQPLNQSVVRILAHGNMLGKGHLVAVGEKLGVRVTEFAPNDL
jgi:type III secretion protein Q